MKYEITNNAITIYDTQKYTTIEDFLNTYKQSRKNKYLFIQNKQILLDDQPVKNIQAPIHNKPITIIGKQAKQNVRSSTKIHFYSWYIKTQDVLFMEKKTIRLV